GTGQGLAIAYGVVQAHQGTLMVTNREQGGAQFTISVPWRAQEAEDRTDGQAGKA
ncbi:MAG: sensor histidine kinase, partial [Novacetimonas hansenii]